MIYVLRICRLMAKEPPKRFSCRIFFCHFAKLSTPKTQLWDGRKFICFKNIKNILLILYILLIRCLCHHILPIFLGSLVGYCNGFCPCLFSLTLVFGLLEHMQQAPNILAIFSPKVSWGIVFYLKSLNSAFLMHCFQFLASPR